MLPQSNVYLTGDFNIDLHKHTAAAFEDIMFGNGFSPIISIATHFKPGCSPSCIDNIHSDTPARIPLLGLIHSVASFQISPLVSLNSDPSVRFLPLGTLPLIYLLSDPLARIPLLGSIRSDPSSLSPTLGSLRSNSSARILQLGSLHSDTPLGSL